MIWNINLNNFTQSILLLSLVRKVLAKEVNIVRVPACVCGAGRGGWGIVWEETGSTPVVKTKTNCLLFRS